MNSRQSFHSIEGLRAWMAWWVVLGHAIQLCGGPAWLPQNIQQRLLNNEAAVEVFIIVSGFVIAHLRLSTQETYPQYLTRRFFRIVPIYAFCLVLAIATMAAYEWAYTLPWATLQEMRVDRFAQTHAHWWSHVAAHATLLHGLIPNSVLAYAGGTLLAPAWSLSLEWQFYLLAPLLLAAMFKGGRSLFVVCALLLAAGWLSRRWWLDEYQYPSMLLLSIHWFVVGIVSRIALDRLAGLGRPVFAALGVLFVAALLAKSLVLVIWIPFLAVVAMQHAGMHLRFVEKIDWLVASNPLARTLGKVSYSTYLVHIPLFAIVAWTWARFSPIDTQRDFQAAVALAIVLVPFVSLLLYEWIEKPFISIGKNLSRPRPAAPTPLKAPIAESHH